MCMQVVPHSLAALHVVVPSHRSHRADLSAHPPQVCVFTAPLFSAFCAIATYLFMKEVGGVGVGVWGWPRTLLGGPNRWPHGPHWLSQPAWVRRQVVVGAVRQRHSWECAAARGPLCFAPPPPPPPSPPPLLRRPARLACPCCVPARPRPVPSLAALPLSLAGARPWRGAGVCRHHRGGALLHLSLGGGVVRPGGGGHLCPGLCLLPVHQGAPCCCLLVGGEPAGRRACCVEVLPRPRPCS